MKPTELVRICRHCEERSERRFHGEWIAPKSEARLRLLKPLNLETTMLLAMTVSSQPFAVAAIQAANFRLLGINLRERGFNKAPNQKIQGG
jgi:hypothetical protein